MLSHLVRVVFAIPVASSKSERVFSVAGMVVSVSQESQPRPSDGTGPRHHKDQYKHTQRDGHQEVIITDQ